MENENNYQEIQIVSILPNGVILRGSIEYEQDNNRIKISNEFNPETVETYPMVIPNKVYDDIEKEYLEDFQDYLFTTLYSVGQKSLEHLYYQSLNNTKKDEKISPEI